MSEKNQIISEEIARKTEEFLANGGAIQHLDYGVRTDDHLTFRFCRCGCSGKPSRHREISLLAGRDPYEVVRK